MGVLEDFLSSLLVLFFKGSVLSVGIGLGLRVYPYRSIIDQDNGGEYSVWREVVWLVEALGSGIQLYVLPI